MLLVCLFASRTLRKNGSDDASHYGKNDQMGDMNDMHMNVIESNGAIEFPPTTWRATFHVIGTMLQFLQIKGMFGGLSHEDPPKLCGYLWVVHLQKHLRRIYSTEIISLLLHGGNY